MISVVVVVVSVGTTLGIGDEVGADCNVCGDVREVAGYIPGDANGDGIVNNKDVGLLQRYNNGWDVEINEKAADVNGDGLVNNKDVGILQRYNNGWDVSLG